jgi:hypothetical protein
MMTLGVLPPLLLAVLIFPPALFVLVLLRLAG